MSHQSSTPVKHIFRVDRSQIRSKTPTVVDHTPNFGDQSSKFIKKRLQNAKTRENIFSKSAKKNISSAPKSSNSQVEMLSESSNSNLSADSDVEEDALMECQPIKKINKPLLNLRSKTQNLVDEIHRLSLSKAQDRAHLVDVTDLYLTKKKGSEISLLALAASPNQISIIDSFPFQGNLGQIPSINDCISPMP